MIVGQLLQISNLTQLALQSANATTPPGPGVLQSPPPLSMTGGIDLYACNVIMYVGLQLVDFTACFVLLHRCYALYNRSWKILVAPLIMVVADIGVYSASLPIFIKLPFGSIQNVVTIDNRKMVALSTTVIVLNALSNGSLTLLIAGRIWMIRRQLHKLIGESAPAMCRKYDTLIAMTLESGMIIPVSLIALEVCLRTNKAEGAGILGSCISQIIAFAPLLIMVRAGLGLTVEASHVTMQAESISREMEFASRPLTVSMAMSQTRSIASSGTKDGDIDDSNPVLAGHTDAKQVRYQV
uniref:Uncharacterized protein n=1 Tax=Moniliophthora roreri TaxID=221103 RepID=A0A0W0FKA1_MONRR